MSDEEKGIQEYTQHGTKFIGFGKVYGEESFNNQPINASSDQDGDEEGIYRYTQNGTQFIGFGKVYGEQSFNGQPLNKKE